MIIVSLSPRIVTLNQTDTSGSKITSPIKSADSAIQTFAGLKFGFLFGGYKSLLYYNWKIEFMNFCSKCSSAQIEKKVPDGDTHERLVYTM